MNTTTPRRIERLTPGLRDAPDHYYGTMSMFENAGFATRARHDDLTVVRKSLR